MTKENITTEKAMIAERISVLESVATHTADLPWNGNITIGTMLKEYKDRLDYLKSPKEYMIAFEGGGWNTVYGVDDEEAIGNAKTEYSDGNPNLIVKRVTLSTKEAKEAAMRLFY
jgi:hypothetical protein